MANSGIKINLAYALGAEGLQLLQSILMSLIIPKILGVEQFGFWQLFIFYTSYGGFFHLGLLDGIYLKTGGKHSSDVNFIQLAAQLKILFLWLVLILTPIAFWGLSNNDYSRKIVIVSSCIYIILFNVLTYHSYLLQCINDIRSYSFGRFIDMTCFICGLIVLLVGRIDFFFPYILVYFVAKLISLAYYGKRLELLWKNISVCINNQVFVEAIGNIKIGVNLLASNIASILVLGIGRWMVDKEWGIESFSKISFSLIFVNFFLMFIQQASMVLFPDLRRRSNAQLESIYDRMKKAIQCIIPIVMLSYLPFVLLIESWLPKYSDSILYLIYLLPMCCFDTKMQLIYNTMFKVKRMEKKLLLCNVLSLLASTFFIFVAIYLFNSVTCVVISMFCAIMLRSVLAEYMVEKQMALPFRSLLSDLLPELITIGVFIYCLNIFGTYLGWSVYFGFVILYVVINYSKYKTVIKR